MRGKQRRGSSILKENFDYNSLLMHGTKENQYNSLHHHPTIDLHTLPLSRAGSKSHRTFGKDLTNLKNATNIRNNQFIRKKVLPGTSQNPLNTSFGLNRVTHQPSTTTASCCIAAPSLRRQNTIVGTTPLYSEEQEISERLRAFSASKQMYQETLSSVDLEAQNNPQECAEYAHCVSKHMRETESVHLTRGEYMKTQPDINDRMRAILLDWLVEVHLKFKLLPETMFLTTNIIDRFLEVSPMERQKLQLIGVTAMLIASKYEEIYAPEVRDFVYITDRAYTKEEILEMEFKVLQILDFNLNVPSSYRFLERYCKLIRGDDLTFFLTRYLLELAIIDYKMLKYSPSQLTAGGLYLAVKILKRSVNWAEPTIIEEMKYTEHELRSSARDLCLLLQNAEKSSLQAVRKKFSTAHYKEVSKIKIETS